ncbi:hypothetical protein [Microvirga rosea]|uniref:hypothetical protein n=1 Tax=Microvirga rosea TaxID=2715425 RepID=UPI001D0B8564|nr:hypothetical protein [Microvirga rosea]MCB8821262.1 hypothetical protein [Microvirga rosea]
MSRLRKSLSVALFRKIEGPEILKALEVARRKLSVAPFPLGTPDKLTANDLISRIDDMAELLTGDRTHFQGKSHRASSHYGGKVH